MVAKRSSRALALLLALPSAAFALGLGDIRLLSSLNAPLNAEIEVTDVAPDEVNTVQAQLASRDTFTRNGLDYPSYLSGVQLRAVRTPDGRELIRLKSADPIADPFVTLLVEVNWSHGQLVREYTLLLDPPVYAPGQSPSNAPVNAATSGGGAHEGAIARGTETPPPAPPAPAVEPSAPAGASTAPAPSATEAASAATARANQDEAPAAAPGAGSSRTVRSGETLSEIAGQVAGAGAFSPRARSWMLAIYQANPRAFEHNMNIMRAGSVLRIPEAAQAAAISPEEATAEIRRQYAAWHGAAGAEGAGTAATGAQPGRLHLVTPTQAGTAGTSEGAAAGAEVGRLQNEVKDLQSQLAESKRLLDLKNADLERLQAQLAAKQAEKPAAAPPPPAAAPVAQAAPPPAATPAPPEQPPAPAEQPPAAAATPGPPPAETPAPPPKPAPAIMPPAESGSLLDTLMGYWWVLALILAAIVAIALLRMVRSRRESEFDDSLGRLAVAGAGAGGVFGGAAPARGMGSVEPAIRAAAPEPEERAVDLEESDTHELPRVTTPPTPPAAKHVAAEDTISSETAINLDQGDPLAEADFHMAYGLYDQAADLIRIAISREPGRRDLKLKLLEVFFVWGNKEQFLQTAYELAGSRAEAAPGEWEKILIMGKQLAPEDSLFTGAAVSGATAGGVDLNLEGGQSRVDFDLLGEPVSSDVPQGVDLDIGSAVGEADATAQMTAEATTNITDRHTAILEGTLPGGTAATGQTRQMTAKLRQPGAAASDVEGPTVEQPALAGDGSPTIRKKVESALHRSGAEQTAELALDDLGLDLGSIDTVDQPVLGMPSSADGPTLVANVDEHTRRNLEDTARHAAHQGTSSTGAWQFDQDELESALAKGGGGSDGTARLAALKDRGVDVDLSTESTGTHERPAGLDIDVGSATGTHPAAGGRLDLDVGTATVPDTAFAATQRLASEDLALPDLEPVTMSEVGTKLDLARAYMDMGDPDGARNILEEVLSEGSAAQKQEAQRLMESLPG